MVAPMQEENSSPDDNSILVGYPTEDFPGPPPFRFRLPGDWRAVPTPHAEALVASSVEIDGVRPNVVIRWHRLGAVEDPGVLLNQLMETELRSHGVDSPELKADPKALSLTASFVRNASVEESQDETVPVAQMFGLHYVPGEWIAFVLAVSGSFASSSEASHQQVRQILDSIQL